MSRQASQIIRVLACIAWAVNVPVALYRHRPGFAVLATVLACVFFWMFVDTTR